MNLRNSLAEEAVVLNGLSSDSECPFYSNSPAKKLTIKCDGLCEPNPGGIGTWAFIVYDEDGNFVTEDYGVALEGEGATNNVAEYWAVIKAIEWLTEQDDEYEAEILSDSQLVVQQLNGKWACHKPHLMALYLTAYGLLELLNVCNFGWIPRSENQAADALTRLAYMNALKDEEGGVEEGSEEEGGGDD
jgi:ribonuclease HI